MSGLISEAMLQRHEQVVFAVMIPNFWKRYGDTFVIFKEDNLSAFHQLVTHNVTRNQFHDGDSSWKQTMNMASPTLCQKRLLTDCPTPSYLHFYHISQTNQITSGNTSKCEGPFANMKAAERGVPHPLLELS